MRKIIWMVIVSALALLALVIQFIAPGAPEPAPSVRPYPAPHAWDVSPT